jgi:hypothetical protein
LRETDPFHCATLYYTAQIASYESLLRRIAFDCSKWAAQNHVTVSEFKFFSGDVSIDVAVLEAAVLSLIDELGNTDKRIFILFDEVHRLHTAKEATTTSPTRYCVEFFKELVSPSQPRGHVTFAVTGSAMCEAWLGFTLAGSNGHTLKGTRVRINIPINSDEHVASVAAKELQSWWCSTNQNNAGILPTQLLVSPYRDPSFLSYLILIYNTTKAGSVSDSSDTMLLRTYKTVMQKLTADFTAEIQPLYTALSMHDNKSVMNMCQCIRAGCTVNPVIWLPKGVDDYLDGYITEIKNTDTGDTLWRMLPSPYSYLLQQAISADGTLKQNVLTRSTLFANGLHYYGILQYLVVTYTTCRFAQDVVSGTVTAVTKEDLDSSSLQLLDALVQQADAAQWLLTDDMSMILADSSFAYVLNHGANSKGTATEVGKFLKLNNGRLSEAGVRRELLLLYWTLLRNLWGHHNLVDQNVDKVDTINYVDLVQLAQHLPPFLPQAVAAMKTAIEKR